MYFPLKRGGGFLKGLCPLLFIFSSTRQAKNYISRFNLPKGALHGLLMASLARRFAISALSRFFQPAGPLNHQIISEHPIHDTIRNGFLSGVNIPGKNMLFASYTRYAGQPLRSAGSRNNAQFTSGGQPAFSAQLQVTGLGVPTPPPASLLIALWRLWREWLFSKNFMPALIGGFSGLLSRLEAQ